MPRLFIVPPAEKLRAFLRLEIEVLARLFNTTPQRMNMLIRRERMANIMPSGITRFYMIVEDLPVEDYEAAIHAFYWDSAMLHVVQA